MAEQTDHQLIVGDEELFPGFDEALKSMKNKEEASFTFQPSQAYGSQGNAELKVPGDAVVKADVKVCCKLEGIIPMLQQAFLEMLVCKLFACIAVRLIAPTCGCRLFPSSLPKTTGRSTVKRRSLKPKPERQLALTCLKRWVQWVARKAADRAVGDVDTSKVSHG